MRVSTCSAMSSTLRTPAEAKGADKFNTLGLERLADVDELSDTILRLRWATEEGLELCLFLVGAGRELGGGPRLSRLEEVRHENLGVQLLGDDVCALLRLRLEAGAPCYLPSPFLDMCAQETYPKMS